MATKFLLTFLIIYTFALLLALAAHEEEDLAKQSKIAHIIGDLSTMGVFGSAIWMVWS